MFLTYAEAANAQKELGAIPADPLTTPIDHARIQQDIYFKILNQNPPDICKTTDFVLDGPFGEIAIRMNYPSLDQELNCIVFIRGAGFWAGGLDSHTTTTRNLANLSRCVVCAIDYKRTPEFRFPTQRDEILVVLGWLQKNQQNLGIKSKQFVLFGESAGATIALSVAMKLRDEKNSIIAGLCLFYANAAGPKPTLRAYSKWVWEQYLGYSGVSVDSNAVPLLDSLENMPPTWIGVGDGDPLLEDSQQLYEKLSKATDKVTLKVYPELPHAFLMYSGSLKPALEALKEASLQCQNFFSENTLSTIRS
jgi:acetyl esterase